MNTRSKLKNYRRRERLFMQSMRNNTCKQIADEYTRSRRICEEPMNMQGPLKSGALFGPWGEKCANPIRQPLHPAYVCAPVHRRYVEDSFLTKAGSRFSSDRNTTWDSKLWYSIYWLKVILQNSDFVEIFQSIVMRRIRYMKDGLIDAGVTFHLVRSASTG